MRINKAAPPAQNGGNERFEDGTVYMVVNRVAERVRNLNHDASVARQFVMLRDMLSCADNSGVLSENDVEKLVRQHFDVALASLTYDEKVAVINKIYGKNYRVYSGNIIPSTSAFQSLWDVAGRVVDYLHQNGLTPFKDDEYAMFKQAYESMLVVYPDVDKIVNGNLKELWRTYRQIRDRQTQNGRII